jgi:hypothetical protein
MIVMLSFLITVCVIYAVVQPPEPSAEQNLRDPERLDNDGRMMGQLIALDRAIRRFEPARVPRTERVGEGEAEKVLKTAG